MKHTLRWNSAISAIARAKTVEARAQVLARLDELHQQSDPITREVIDLRLAEQYIRLREWDEAARVLARIKEARNISSELQRIIDSEREW